MAWPPAMPREPLAWASRAIISSCCLGSPSRLAGQHLEGHGLQAVADQQGGRFVVLDVAGRAAAAQHVVVHARQVVVDQRIGVDHFDGAGDDVEASGCGIGQFAGGEGEQGRTRLPPPRVA